MIPVVTPETLQSRENARDLLNDILDGDFPPQEIQQFLTELKNFPVTPEWVMGFRDAMMARAQNFEITAPVTDICGTGGDGKNTFNISTLAALTAAACGHAVAKHGNSASTSHSGSSDILRALEIPMPQSADAAQQQINRAGIAFLHAPYFHPALAAIGAARKTLGFPTVFNILGPLCHPARPAYRVLGVASRQTYDLYRAIAPMLGGRYAIILDDNGYDEISLTASAKICINGTEQILSPHDFGLSPLLPDDLITAPDMTENKNLFLSIARGAGSAAQNATVAANAAVAIHLAEPTRSIAEHFQTARATLQSGHVMDVIEKLKGTA